MKEFDIEVSLSNLDRLHAEFEAIAIETHKAYKWGIFNAVLELTRAAEINNTPKPRSVTITLSQEAYLEFSPENEPECVLRMMGVDVTLKPPNQPR